MATLLRRSLVAALVTVVSGAGLVALAAPASAEPVEYGTLAFSGDPGDYITGGGSYKYDTLAGDELSASASADGGTVSISLDGTTGDWWFVDFDAPNGQSLTSGTTYTAVRYPFNGTGAGFSLDGNGRGCNELTATFTVIEAVFENGGVTSFHATFEQHCEGSEPAARGEVHIGPAPTPLALTTTVAPTGTVSPVSGRARVNAELTCTQPVTITLSGDLSQVVRNRIVRGPLSGTVSCTPDAPVSWTTIVTPSGNRPFVAGTAEVDVTATAHDLAYDKDVTTSVTSVTTLEESSPALTDF